MKWAVASLVRGAALVTLALAVVACRTPPSGGLGIWGVENVILISIDSLRVDHLGTYGYSAPTSPTIDRLAASGLVFDRAYSTTSWTLPAHVALLTGLDDFAHGIVSDGLALPSKIETLAETLEFAGIGTVAFFSGPYLHPAFGLSQGFDQYVNCTRFQRAPKDKFPTGLAMLASHQDVTNPIILRKIRDWLRRGQQGRRNFIFIHMWDVHYDYIPPESYVTLFDPDYRGPLRDDFYKHLRGNMPRRDLQHVIARYDGEIRYTDDTISRFLRLLRKSGLMERAAVIVLSDHGEEFYEHGRKGHRTTLFEEVLRIPLVLTVAGHTPVTGRVEQVVSIVDVYPTVCDLFGVPCRADLSGESLMRFFHGRELTKWRGDALAELTLPQANSHITALVRKEGKVMHHRNAQKTTYFDAAKLPSEQAGLVVNEDHLGEYDASVQKAVVELERRVSEARDKGRRIHDDVLPSAPDLGEDTKEHLRSLGYIE